MSCVLDSLKELRKGLPIEATCPECGRMQWWRKDLGTASGAFLDCFAVGACAFKLDLNAKPPPILCSSCGLALEQHDHGFRCRPCQREVQP